MKAKVYVTVKYPGQDIYEEGLCYDIGNGQIQNPKRAFELYWESAKKGYHKALYKLALNVLKETHFRIKQNKFLGMDVDVDAKEVNSGINYERAYFWILLACSYCPKENDKYVNKIEAVDDFRIYSNLRDEVKSKLRKSEITQIELDANKMKSSIDFKNSNGIIGLLDDFNKMLNKMC